MSALAWLRELFPASFRQEFGPAWESVAEDLLAEARTRGPLALAAAWLSLAVDVGCQAPGAHARHWGVVLMGRRPVLAGLGPVAATAAFARHWGWRPLKALGRGLKRDAGWVAFGALVSGFVVMRLSWGQGVFPSELTAGLEDSNEMTKRMATGLALLLAIIFASPLLASPRHFVARWRRTGRPVVAPLSSAALGFLLATYLLLLAQLPAVATAAVADFIAYPRLQELIRQHAPKGDPEDQWTAEQRQRYMLVADRLVVRSEHRLEYCTRMNASLETERILMQSNPDGLNEIPSLLWAGKMQVAGSMGCQSLDEVFAAHQAMGDWVATAPGKFQRTWEPLSFLPGIGAVMSARYIILPSTRPTIENYCALAADEYARKNDTAVDSHVFLANYCTRLSEQFHRADPPRSQSLRLHWWGPLMHRLGLTPLWAIKDHAARTRKMTTQDLAWVRAQVRDDAGLWSKPSTATP